MSVSAQTVTGSATTAGLSPALAAALAARFGDRLSTATALREQHARGESPFPPALPDAVVFIQSAEEVQFVLRHCHEAGVPVIAHGAGSSLEGQLLALRGGVSLDLTRMDRILRIDDEDFTATVEPGVTKEQLNQALRDLGLFFPVDPGAHATLGGMCATRASGTTTVRYGTMRDNVRAMQVVLADGRLIRSGTRAVKSSAGYDLTRLFIGSEGTLGVITEVTLQLYPLPEAVSAAVVTFAETEGAVRTVIESLQAGLPVARSEYLCAASIRAIAAAHPGLALRERPTLFVEFHGSPAALAEQSELLREIAQGHGGEDLSMIRTLGKAFYWQKLLDQGKYPTIRDMAHALKLEQGWMAEVLRMTTLAPDIIESILEGRQPRHLNLQTLRGRHAQLPRDWQEQRVMFGYAD